MDTMMKNNFFLATIFVSLGLFFTSCEKWEDKPAKDLGLSNKYCNLPGAINYNVGFPGIPDNSVCILPSTPFVGRFGFRDSIFNLANELSIGDSLILEITAIDSTRLSLAQLCPSGRSLVFVANRFYRAESDSIIGAGAQLFCRDVDTASGRLEYRLADSSLYLEITVVSDTSISYHKGRAYKK